MDAGAGGRAWVGGAWDNCKRLNAPPKNLLQEFERDAGVHRNPRCTHPPTPCTSQAGPSFAGWNLLEAVRAGR